MKIIYFLFRLIALPFIMMVVLPRFMLTYCIFMYNFIRYGGETIAYLREDKPMISDIYQLLKKEHEKI